MMPVLFWYQTWFGRRLTNQEIGRYLADYEHPRKIQHALAQISDRMAAGDSAVRIWYPRLAEAARQPTVEIRTTAAWTMGQDNSSDLLHRALLGLLNDPELVVRRNAALALVRFGDARGRSELVSMLHPYDVRAGQPGIVSVQVRRGQEVKRGTPIARIVTGPDSSTTVLSPCAARVGALPAADGSRVHEGDTIATLDPEPDEVWEALRGLYLVGQREDLGAVEPYTRPAPGVSDRVREQAVQTARAIQMRSESSPAR
jgi:hypothetical protein